MREPHMFLFFGFAQTLNMNQGGADVGSQSDYSGRCMPNCLLSKGAEDQPYFSDKPHVERCWPWGGRK